MSSDYVRVTFIGLRGPGDPTNDDIRDALLVGDCGELDIVVDYIGSITVEDISAAEVRDWRKDVDDETPAWEIDALQDERQARE